MGERPSPLAWPAYPPAALDTGPAAVASTPARRFNPVQSSRCPCIAVHRPDAWRGAVGPGTELPGVVGEVWVVVPTGSAWSAGGPRSYRELPESVCSQAVSARHPTAAKTINLLMMTPSVEPKPGLSRERCARSAPLWCAGRCAPLLPESRGKGPSSARPVAQPLVASAPGEAPNQHRAPCFATTRRVGRPTIGQWL
jgi:hypothetical protein